MKPLFQNLQRWPSGVDLAYSASHLAGGKNAERVRNLPAVALARSSSTKPLGVLVSTAFLVFAINQETNQ